jgi:uncharacterized protein (DUF934 family)
MPLIRATGAAVDDPWLSVKDEEPLPDTGAVVVTLVRFQANRDQLLARATPLGLRLKSDQAPSLIAGDVERFDVIALEFPKFTDGRALSAARLLRERYGYRGELRAVGNVLRDQYLFMDRCGIDSIEIADEANVAGYLESLGEFSIWYQPAADQRPTVRALRAAKQMEPTGGSAVVRESVAASWAY